MHCRHSFHLQLQGGNLTCHGSGLVIDQARKDGFRFRNQEETDSQAPIEEKVTEVSEKEESVEKA